MAGGIPKQVLEGVAYASADWAPNGKDLVVVHHLGGKTRLEFPIGKPIVEGDIESPRFSPNGARIAFFEEGHLAVIDSAGKEKKALSLSGLGDIAGAPCWRPDGQEIWFSAAEAGQSEALYAVDLSGKRRLVLRVPGQLELDDISRDGRVLVAHHTNVKIVMGLSPGEKGERDLSWLDGSVPADLSPDGKTLVFTESGEGSGAAPAVYMRGTDGSPAVRLGEGSALALSPDGKWVLAAVVPGGGEPAQLVVLPTGLGQAKTLKNDRFLSYTAAAWLPDEKRIVLTAQEKNHDLHIYVQDLEGGSPRLVASERSRIPPGTSPVSPDGKFVFGIRGDRDEIALFPIEGGEPRRVVGLEPRDMPFQWSADSALYVRNQAATPAKVWLLDPVSGQRRPWLGIKPGDPEFRFVRQLLITRDGKSYVYGTQRVLSELYLIEGLK